VLAIGSLIVALLAGGFAIIVVIVRVWKTEKKDFARKLSIALGMAPVYVVLGAVYVVLGAVGLLILGAMVFLQIMLNYYLSSL
jgi:hypothetical protein